MTLQTLPDNWSWEDVTVTFRMARSGDLCCEVCCIADGAYWRAEIVSTGDAKVSKGVFACGKTWQLALSMAESMAIACGMAGPKEVQRADPA